MDTATDSAKESATDPTCQELLMFITGPAWCCAFLFSSRQTRFDGVDLDWLSSGVQKRGPSNPYSVDVSRVSEKKYGKATRASRLDPGTLNPPWRKASSFSDRHLGDFRMTALYAEPSYNFPVAASTKSRAMPEAHAASVSRHASEKTNRHHLQDPVQDPCLPILFTYPHIKP